MYYAYAAGVSNPLVEGLWAAFFIALTAWLIHWLWDKFF